MPHNKRSVVTVFSVIYLVALTVVACYTHYMIQRLSLPIPSILSGLTIVLPALHGVCIERLSRNDGSTSRPTSLSLAIADQRRRSSATSYGSSTITRSKQHRQQQQQGSRHTALSSLVMLALTVLTAAMATVAGTRLAPADTLRCGIDDRWRSLFRAHKESEIRRIQDAFECCGLHSVYDMAWPFAKHDGGKTIASTCARTYGRETPCFGAWRGEQQVVAGLVVVVCVGVWVWDMLIVYIPARRPSWFDRVAHAAKPGNHANGNGDARRAIGYRDEEDGYPEPPIVHVEDADADAEDAEDEPTESPRSRTGSGTVQRAIESRLGIDGEHGEHHTLVPSSQTSREENEWATSPTRS